MHRRMIGKFPPFLVAVLLLLLSVMLVACDGQKEPQESLAESESEVVTEGFTGNSSDTETEAPAESETIRENETNEETQPEETTAPEEDTRVEMDIFGNSYNTNMLVGFDEQGHLVNAVSAEKQDHEVGIFYFLWLGQPFATDIYDVSHILAEHGPDVAFHQDVADVSPAGQFHWWEEPLFGYYNSSDEWVIRKHLEMLTDAGVDFLVFDTTNAVTYDNVAKRVMQVISELRAEGWDAPQVVYYTHSYSIRTMTHLYENIYKQEVYPDAWYCVDGKPMIIGYINEADDKKATGDASYNPGDLSQEMQDFFYIRIARWPFDPVVKNGWPYTEWTYPQPLNTDMVSVSIATHPMVPFSFSLTHENWCNWGRGYNPRTKENVHEDIMKGTFYDLQWNLAIKRDPRFVFVTGWNEWIALKSWYEGEYMFCDNVDMEYSRDAEPMMGGYEDAYFIQTIQRIREYKFEPIDGYIAQTVRKTIDITGPATQWDEINAIYRRVGTDNGERNAYGGAKTVKYENDPVRNNILEVRVTCDAENIYFMIRTEADIVTVNESNWMNLFIGCGRPEMGKGWESYEYVINRSRTDGKATVERLQADYTGEVIGEALFTVQGNVMQISVSRALLGLEGISDFYFKVSDEVKDPAEIMNYYASGRSLPMGRLSYLYQIGKN